MKPFCVMSRVRQAFTLIELLVVIAIISTLAAMILPALSRVRTQAKAKQAKMEMANLASAINQYQSEYSRLPTGSQVPQAANPDYTFGTAIATPVLTTNLLGLGGNLEIRNNNRAGGYYNCNAEIISILRNDDYYPNAEGGVTNKLNPRKMQFFSAKIAQTTSDPGIGPDHVFRDPFGKPYIITLDMNYDNKCQDAYYFQNTMNTNPVPGNVMIWSLGPDGKHDTSATPTPKSKENKDNILSWD